MAGSLWSWACKGDLLRISRLIITALVATLAFVACRTNVTTNIQPSSKPAVGLDPLTDVDQLKAFLRLRFLSYPIKPEHLDLILSAANEVIGTNLTKEQAPWSPEDIGLILTRLVEKAKLPGVLEAQSLRVSFALTTVTGLNDFVGGIILDSCSRVTYSSSMASHLGKLFESLFMKSRQMEEFAPQVYQELILIRGGQPPSNCRKTLRYATARSLISGAKDGGTKTPALATIVSALIKEEIRLARLAGVSATTLSAGLSVWENRVLDNNESLSVTNGLVEALKTSVETTASDEGVIAIVTPIPAQPEPQPAKDISGDTLQAGEFCGGLGVADWPYKICNLATLKNIANYPEASFVLTNNIDASPTVLWDEGAGWTPLGNTSRPFSGSLDGQGYRISGLTINRPPMIDVGFIGYASASSVLKNVRFENIDVQGMKNVGGVAGFSLGTIQNVSVNGSVRGVDYVGGLIGYFTGGGTTPASITDSNANDIEVSGKTFVGGIAGEMRGGASLTRSWSSGTVTGHPAEGIAAGGLLGRLDSGTVSRSYSTATVSANIEVGGLIGRIYSQVSICLIEYSHASGNVTARGTTGLNQGYGAGVGGLVGASGECLRVKKSYATGNVTSEHATGAVLGGLVGALNWGGGQSIEDSYATGNLTTASTGGAAGGLVGYTGGTIFRSYATGTVNSPNSNHTGGLVGSNGVGIYDSFSTGVVAGPTGGNRGGFLGNVYWGAMINSYWLKPSGSLFTCLGTGSHPGCTELSDSRFFIQAGGPLFSAWDFNTVWYFPASGGLPLLRD